MSEDSPQRKQKMFINITRPKHPEGYSLEECAAFQPWRVVLKIELDAEDPEPVDYELFLRAPSNGDAQWTAYTFFMVLTHKGKTAKEKLKSQDYPKICYGKDAGSYCIALSEDQWKEFYREGLRIAEKDPDRFIRLGMRENPSVFRIIRPGWDKRSGLLKGLGNNIIMPDASAIKSVQKAKDFIDRKAK